MFANNASIISTMSRTEDLPSDKGGEFTFQWTIVNLYVFEGDQGMELESHKFTVPCLQDTEWCLKLVLKDDMRFLQCFLRRLDKGPENMAINFSLSVGSSYFLEHEWFEKNSSSTKPCIINIHELGQKVKQGLTKETLIECRLWPRANEYILSESAIKRPYPVFFSTRTVIPCEQRNFYFPLNNFSDLSKGLIEFVRVESGAGSNSTFFCELHKVSYTTLGKTFQLKFVTSEMITFLVKYKIRLVDAHKKHHSLLSGRLIFQRDCPGLNFLIPSLMLKEKDLYIPGDVMHLSFEFDISPTDGVVSFVESTRYDSSDIQSANIVCGWGLYLGNKYYEHRFLCRLLAVLMIIFSLLIPHLLTDNSV